MMSRQSANSLTMKRVKALDARPGVRLAANWGHITVLENGGHICELVSKKHNGVNPLWRPPWKTIDPHLYNPAKHSRLYGQRPDGRLLAGIAGHNLSFDHFGPPSPEESAAGLSTHGEASWRRWHWSRSANGLPSMEGHVRLQDAQIDLRRSISLEPNDAVIYCQETARNLTSFDRPISWNQHVTFGPPFLEAGMSRFDMPASSGKVCPASYSSRMLLKPDAEFKWPFAPSTTGKKADLCLTPGGVFGRYTAQLLNPLLDIGWIAAGNPRIGLLVVYVFRRLDFPWVGNWEERFYRKSAPWKGKTFCRGMEFSTTPFAVPRRESVTHGKLFGESTYQWLPAKSERKIRYVILLLDIPEHFAGLEQVLHHRGRVHIKGKSSKEKGRTDLAIAVRVRKFL
jgi:hypothetical protein